MQFFCSHFFKEAPQALELYIWFHSFLRKVIRIGTLWFVPPNVLVLAALVGPRRGAQGEGPLRVLSQRHPEERRPNGRLRYAKEQVPY